VGKQTVTKKPTPRTLSETAYKELWLKGNSTCPGCSLSLAMRWALKALGPNTCVVAPASCTNVVVGLYPRSASAVPFTNMVFAGGASAASGIRAALRARGQHDTNVLVWAGDGGTFDIGIQALSGAAERGDDIIYICYDNEAYMNTGTQRSGATPFGAITTTTPAGKKEHKKDLMAIMAGHRLDYLATASAAHPVDLYEKVCKAKTHRGLKFIHLLASCPPGWRYQPRHSVKVGKLAVQTGMWALYEIENGRMKLTGPSKAMARPDAKMKPLSEYLELQGRFRLATEGPTYDELERWVRSNWQAIRERVGKVETSKSRNVEIARSTTDASSETRP
jgi:pyruvate ferredoxin oxidoreductase beta subunit